MPVPMAHLCRCADTFFVDHALGLQVCRIQDGTHFIIESESMEKRSTSCLFLFCFSRDAPIPQTVQKRKRVSVCVCWACFMWLVKNEMRVLAILAPVWRRWIHNLRGREKEGVCLWVRVCILLIYACLRSATTAPTFNEVQKRAPFYSNAYV